MIWYNHVPESFCEIDPSDLLSSALLIFLFDLLFDFVIAWCWFWIATGAGGFLECSMGFLHLQRRGEAIDREQQCTAFRLDLTNRLFKTLELSLLHHILCNQLRKVQGVLFTVPFFCVFDLLHKCEGRHEVFWRTDKIYFLFFPLWRGPCFCPTLPVIVTWRFMCVLT